MDPRILRFSTRKTDPIGEAHEARPSPRPPPKKLSPVVLIVDDEADSRQLASDFLTLHGFHVIIAKHGREAIERLCQHNPDLVLLDLDMPVMDGWQFLSAQARLADSHLINIPVLILSGGDAAPEPAAAATAVGRMEKPFDPDRLLSAIQTALRTD